MKTTTFVAVALLALAGWAFACEGGGAESVIECYARAYAERDVEALERLYAPGYTWTIVVPPEVHTWDREKTIESAAKMFDHPELKDISLVLPSGYSVEENKDDGTWLITGIAASILTSYGEPAVTDTSHSCVTLYVGEVEPGIYEITREVAFGNGDCEGWLRD